ncbi:hypothetical protein C2G38_2044424 [Gigaspora rosea]|uniref:Uncharacterized protein n=1 Tax=Gigaspora rosea TaxID=44941 RepID=A0A397UQ84_9GLOM|nr:hypothetical protein C2G38_2044424 [Gigaspora rosea]
MCSKFFRGVGLDALASTFCGTSISGISPVKRSTASSLASIGWCIGGFSSNDMRSPFGTEIFEMFIDYIEKLGKYIKKPVYGRGCRCPEGYHEHWRAKKRVLCNDCGKPTASACGRYKKHAKGYYVMQFYARKLNL